MDNKNTIADWKLERYLLGELPEDEMKAIRALETSCEELRGRIAALVSSNAQILADYPPSIMARLIKNLAADTQPTARVNTSFANAKREKIKQFLPRIAIPAVAFVALLVALPVALPVILNNHNTSTTQAYYEDRVKGTMRNTDSAFAAIEVWRKEGGAARKLTHEEVAREGDIIQLRYVVTEECYGTLISIDGRGVLTVHLSDEFGNATALVPGRPVALRNSYELDDAPHYEIFYLITAPQKFSVNDITTASLTDMSNATEDRLAQVLHGEDRHSVVAFKLLK